ncbi:hypothetical protein CEUSTIGMA_g11214.t1 [Chlamydomonas eustigma]|uniref:Pherophorin domain-containing protein n=1 Tax=Chlamydomonas eustigma TaxID=1157962 RepID=A0A250XLI0_9CHLO|nr:hypothetical protein CEUSTIGMA_g11214.t1 [Chlamydomonas eustigma]|eukprot:GAX83789.1 hypothetical protein CEUSTIGMA_g11214.t1 [Chlamydomonas eustigma]
MYSTAAVSLCLAVLSAVVISVISVGAPPNAIPFSPSLMTGTWSGTCSQSAYINPDIPGQLQCSLTVGWYFSFPFSVTFGTSGSSQTYAYSSGTFNAVGQNVSFSTARVNQTNLPFSSSAQTFNLTNIYNGGSNCVTLANGQSFLGTLVQSIGGYYTYLEEGIRTFNTKAPTASTTSCPNDSNLPQQCSPQTGYSYTCYAIIQQPVTQLNDATR